VLLLAHFEGGALGGGDHDHRPGRLALVLVHGLVDLAEVVVGDVVVLPHLLIVQELFADLGVELVDLGVETLLLLAHAVQPHLQVADFPLDFRVFGAADPLDGVLLYFFNVADALQHVGDVVDASFLHLEDVHRHVEVDRHVLAVFNQFDEFFSEDGKTVILPSAGALLVSLAVEAEVVLLLILVEQFFLYFGCYFLGDPFSHSSDNII
jgi:hypothetical protein